MKDSLGSLLSRWRSDSAVGGNIVEWRSIPARQPEFRPLPGELSPRLVDALGKRGIARLYIHQAKAWESARRGENLVVVTGTASGKTLAYNLPVLDALLSDPQARALYLFPTKALAQDQLHGLRELLDEPPGAAQARGNSGNAVAPAAYDGDTPAGARPAIRKNSRLIVSNPDMLHTGILPHHTVWADFFGNLRYVVIDEMHIYRGVFGSHVANVLRRLKRVCRFYGASPQFVLTSATIGNPGALAEKLVEAPVTLIDRDGSGRGPKHFLFYNPPIVDRELGLRRSSLQESVRLAEDLLAYHVQTILFARSRRSVEIILTYLRERGSNVQAGDMLRGGERHPVDELFPPQFTPGRESKHDAARLPDRSQVIRGYRAGYLPRERREIEQGLRQGEVRAVVATNALELGVDIGGMGAAVLVGYPGTIAGTWQQAGRAGRGSQASLSVLVATADPLDQFLAAHPDYFFERSPEQALINPDNLLILLAHLRCAAFELPFQAGERFGRVDRQTLEDFLQFLQAEGVLHRSGERYFWMADQYPAQAVPLRSASADNVVLQVDGDGAPITLGEIDLESAPRMVHPQAIYLHEGRSYLVEELDLAANLAHLRRMDSDYYTEPQAETLVALVEQHEEAPAAGGAKAFGEISVTSQVVGYRKVRWYTHENLGMGRLDLPPSNLQTTGYWLALSEETVSALQEEGLWTNNPNNYGPAWGRLREQVRARDGYRCQICGALEIDRQHDVHHKVPFRTFSSPEHANKLENLITLCHPCHRRAETAVRVRSGLAGLGFVLGQLAPFFLMTDARDLGVHSDPQSPLAGGQPAVVLYDHVPAGIGFSQRLYELHDELLARAHELVSACPCSDGCPSCVGPGGEQGAGGKQETLAILALLTGKPALKGVKSSGIDHA